MQLFHSFVLLLDIRSTKSTSKYEQHLITDFANSLTAWAVEAKPDITEHYFTMMKNL